MDLTEKKRVDTRIEDNGTVSLSGRLAIIPLSKLTDGHEYEMSVDPKTVQFAFIGRVKSRFHVGSLPRITQIGFKPQTSYSLLLRKHYTVDCCIHHSRGFGRQNTLIDPAGDGTAGKRRFIHLFGAIRWRKRSHDFNRQGCRRNIASSSRRAIHGEGRLRQLQRNGKANRETWLILSGESKPATTCNRINCSTSSRGSSCNLCCGKLGQPPPDAKCPSPKRTRGAAAIWSDDACRAIDIPRIRPAAAACRRTRR
jgi:hypothetical protein